MFKNVYKHNHKFNSFIWCLIFSSFVFGLYLFTLTGRHSGDIVNKWVRNDELFLFIFIKINTVFNSFLIYSSLILSSLGYPAAVLRNFISSAWIHDSYFCAMDHISPPYSNYQIVNAQIGWDSKNLHSTLCVVLEELWYNFNISL